MGNLKRMIEWVVGPSPHPNRPTILVEVEDRDSLEGEIIGRYEGLNVGQAERLADDLNEFCQNWLRQEYSQPTE